MNHHCLPSCLLLPPHHDNKLPSQPCSYSYPHPYPHTGSYPHAQQFYYAVDRGVGNTLTYDAPANLPDYSGIYLSNYPSPNHFHIHLFLSSFWNFHFISLSLFFPFSFSYFFFYYNFYYFLLTFSSSLTFLNI